MENREVKVKTESFMSIANFVEEQPKCIKEEPNYILNRNPKIIKDILNKMYGVKSLLKKSDHDGKHSNLSDIDIEIRNEFRKVLMMLSASKDFDTFTVFSDFILMTACTISNQVDMSHYEEREKLYRTIISDYSKKEQELFPELFALLIMALENNPEQDFFGYFYNEIIPYHIHLILNSTSGVSYKTWNTIAEDILSDIEKDIETNGYVTIHDECCSSGGMLIAIRNVANKKLEKQGRSFHNHIFAIGSDEFPITALMCYIQLSLLGVAGYFKAGGKIKPDDTLEDYWFTPVYFYSIWSTRRILNDILREKNENV